MSLSLLLSSSRLEPAAAWKLLMLLEVMRSLFIEFAIAFARIPSYELFDCWYSDKVMPSRVYHGAMGGAREEGDDHHITADSSHYIERQADSAHSSPEMKRI